MKYSNLIHKTFLVSVGLLVPFFAFALDWSTYTNVVISISILIDQAFGVLLALAVFVVAWGIFKFIAQAGNEQARAQGRAFILWGILGIFIMLSIWGLVNLLDTTIQLNNQPLGVPQITPNYYNN